MKSIVPYHDLIGVPWKDRGRDMSGLDCYGLLMVLFARKGVLFPDFDYPQDAETSLVHRLICENKSLAEPISAPEPWGIVSIAIIPPYESHLGMVINLYEFVHVRMDTRVTVSRIDSPLWRMRIRGLYRWKG